MKSSFSKKPSLPLHEWLIVALFCLILLSLAFFSWGRAVGAGSSLRELSVNSNVPGIRVWVTGEVKNPGFYDLPAKATLKDLLAQVELEESADQTKFNYRRRIRDAETIDIAARKLIKIEVLGAVKNPGMQEVLSGTRCNEWVKQLDLLPQADTRELAKKKRFIREGDCFYIPTRPAQKTKRKNLL